MSTRRRLLVGALLAVALGAAVEWGGRAAASTLTAILVFVTAVYAERTHEMVVEMRTARAAELRPKLIVTMDKFAARAMTPRVLSVGPGSAFDVNVVVTLEPDGPSGPFVGPMLRVGRGQSLLFRDGATGVALAKVEEFKKYQRVSLRGTCSDAMGFRLEVDETLDLAAYTAAYEAGLWKTPGGIKRGKPPLEAIEEILDLIEHHVRFMVQPD